MTAPTVTATYAALLALIFLALSLWVMFGRGQYNVLHGDGGVVLLNRRIRAHANFAEYVPLTLLLVALAEASGVSTATIHLLLATLVIARLAHPIGMVARDQSTTQKLGRGMGMVATFGVICAAAVLLLLRLL